MLNNQKAYYENDFELYDSVKSYLKVENNNNIENKEEWYVVKRFTDSNSWYVNGLDMPKM